MQYFGIDGCVIDAVSPLNDLTDSNGALHIAD